MQNGTIMKNYKLMHNEKIKKKPIFMHNNTMTKPIVM